MENQKRLAQVRSAASALWGFSQWTTFLMPALVERDYKAVSGWPRVKPHEVLLVQEPCWESSISPARLSVLPHPVWRPSRVGCHAAHHPLAVIISHYRASPSYSHQLRQWWLRGDSHPAALNRHSQTLYLILASLDPTPLPWLCQGMFSWQHYGFSSTCLSCDLSLCPPNLSPCSFLTFIYIYFFVEFISIL